jgi:tRNA-binding protein
MITFQDFKKVDIRVGKIIEVKDFPEAKKPAYQLRIDFGPEIGIKNSSAQITHYTKEELMGRLVLCVINFAPRKIGPFLSEVLMLAAPNENNQAILVIPEQQVPIGGKLY